MRIDAHHHVWTLARGDYGWLTPALAPIYRDFHLSDLAPHLAATGIEKGAGSGPAVGVCDGDRFKHRDCNQRLIQNLA